MYTLSITALMKEYGILYARHDELSDQRDLIWKCPSRAGIESREVLIPRDGIGRCPEEIRYEIESSTGVRGLWWVVPTSKSSSSRVTSSAAWSSGGSKGAVSQVLYFSWKTPVKLVHQRGTDSLVLLRHRRRTDGSWQKCASYAHRLSGQLLSQVIPRTLS